MEIILKIGLIDADSHNFPNLALMKISAYQKALGNDVEFVNYWDQYHAVYISKVFSWSSDPLKQYPIKAQSVFMGGSGCANDNYHGIDKQYVLPDYIESHYPDYELYPKIDYALGFLTRGCPRGCPFCIVAKKEGNAHKVANLDQFWNGQKKIVLLDPNILAVSEKHDLLDQILETKAWIDFTQGLDIRLLDGACLEKLIKIKAKSYHFAYDRIEDAEVIESKFRWLKKETGWNRRKVTVYVLVNYDTTIDQDLERIKFLKSLDFTPFVMVYNKQSAANEYRHLQRWCNRPQILFTTDYREYRR